MNFGSGKFCWNVQHICVQFVLNSTSLVVFKIIKQEGVNVPCACISLLVVAPPPPILVPPPLIFRDQECLVFFLFFPPLSLHLPLNSLSLCLPLNSLPLHALQLTDTTCAQHSQYIWYVTHCHYTCYLNYCHRTYLIHYQYTCYLNCHYIQYLMLLNSLSLHLLLKSLSLHVLPNSVISPTTYRLAYWFWNARFLLPVRALFSLNSRCGAMFSISNKQGVHLMGQHHICLLTPQRRRTFKFQHTPGTEEI
jgi:hypothetical protein